MTFPERFSKLPEYAFPRLRTLLNGIEPGGEAIHMTIGEPRHAMPEWISEELSKHTADFGRYPPNFGTPELLETISGWFGGRYSVYLNPETQIMALNGTREGLFNATLALCPETKNGERPVVLTPNPFYQVYAMAALAVGAEPVYMPATAQTGHLPDFAAVAPEILDRTAIAYLCSPANPQGVVANKSYWRTLLKLAEKHDFKVFADECYSEIYREKPPLGALEVAQQSGIGPERVLSFHSLSKRSNLPGLRSGFVAGGPRSIAAIKQLRAYAGAPLPLPIQRVSETVWADENHVIKSRARYQTKFAIADSILGDSPGYTPPEAGFFLWHEVEDGEAAAIKLWRETGVRVLPGAYLSRDVNSDNPGKRYIRVALINDEETTQRGLEAIRDCLTM